MSTNPLGQLNQSSLRALQAASGRLAGQGHVVVAEVQAAHHLADQRHVVGGRDLVPLDHAVDGRVALAPVQRPQGQRHLGVRLGAAQVVADVFVPGGDVIGLAPVIGVFQVAQQRPVARPVAAAAGAAAAGAAARREIIALFPELADRDFVPSPARVLVPGSMGRKLVARHVRNGKLLVN